jgi:hypothetical protein
VGFKLKVYKKLFINSKNQFMAQKKEKQKEIFKEFIKENSTMFKKLYYQALGDFDIKKQLPNDIDSIFGTSKGFMTRLKETFPDEYDKVHNRTNHKKVSTLLYNLDPKCLMDIFWIGHFLGSKTMMDWTQGNLNFAPDLLDDFKRSSSINDGTWNYDWDNK